MAAARRKSLASGGPPGLQPAVAAYFEAATRAAEAIMAGVSLGLGLEADHFAKAYLRRPTRLFRIFRVSANAERQAGASASTPTTAC